MKKDICVLIMILSSVFAGSLLYAQQNIESDILAIRELYRKAQESINLQSGANAVKNQLQVTMQKSWLNRGNQTDTYNYYFHPKVGSTGEDGNLLYRLSFVRIKSSGKARVCSEEYLFNEKGEMVFYFISFKDWNGNDMEIRLYYRNGERIRSLIKQTDKVSKKVTERNSINVLYASEVEHPLKAVVRIKNLFETAINQWMYEPDPDMDNLEHELPIRHIDGGFTGEDDSVSSTTVQGGNESGITMKEAVEILTKKLNDRTLKYLLGEERESETVNGEKAHYIRAYHESSDGLSIATLGHFYIGSRSGKIYITDLVMGNDIIPYDEYQKKYKH